MKKKKIKEKKNTKHYARSGAKEYKKHVTTAILAGFGFIMAFAWRDFIQKLMEKIMGSSIISGTLEAVNAEFIYNLVYALVVSVIAVVAIILISKWAAKDEKKK